LILGRKTTTIEQSEAIKVRQGLKPAPKIFKEDCVIDWRMPAKSIYDFIRGLSPYPAATTVLKADNAKPIYIKVFSSEFVIGGHGNNIGSVEINKQGLRIAVSDGFVALKEVQQAGKRRMQVSDFVRGLALDSGFWVDIQ
jgi:methionyl-tRNA formyltransferase